MLTIIYNSVCTNHVVYKFQKKIPEDFFSVFIISHELRLHPLVQNIEACPIQTHALFADRRGIT